MIVNTSQEHFKIMNNKTKKTERFTISIPKSHYDLIEKMAEKNGVSKSKIVRDAVKVFLGKEIPLFPEL
ncbi:hypothetical protein [uncultured Gammaproteobacteria bacterium]|nr:hypothetical protein [uncultured Gammaproteobacteria bacterium]